MITETVLGVLVDVIFGLLGLVISLLPPIPAFSLPIPRGIWNLLTPAFASLMLFFPPALIWWLWKQTPFAGGGK